MIGLIKKVIKHLKWRYVIYTEITKPQLALAKKLPSIIPAGPFAGMPYIHAFPGGILLPKLVGTYEDELNFIWDEIKDRKYDLVVNAGAAEGYYSLYFFPDVKAIAYEATAEGRRDMAKLVKLNQVEIDIRGICYKENLKETIQGKRTLLIMDIEGAEREVLDVDFIDFSKTDIVLEVHPAYDPDLETKIVERFKPTHLVKIIEPHEKQLPAAVKFPDWVYEKKDFVTSEYRGKQSWLWIQPK